MPTKGKKRVRSNSAESHPEITLADALTAVQDGASMRSAAHDFGVAYSTLRCRKIGAQQARSGSHERQQLLNNAQTTVLVDWCRYQSKLGAPYDRAHLHEKAAHLSGREPGKNWAVRFLKKHEAELNSGKGRGLDPKRAQCFNPHTVEDHFNQIRAIYKDHDIPPANIYNWDEKGLQIGGGRKNLQQHFIFDREDKDRYYARSDSLELVSLLEAVSADGVTFASLASYMRRDDILDIAAAFALDRTGTIPVLKDRIKAHLEAHPELKEEQRFAGLFLTKNPRKRKGTRTGEEEPIAPVEEEAEMA